MSVKRFTTRRTKAAERAAPMSSVNQDGIERQCPIGGFDFDGRGDTRIIVIAIVGSGSVLIVIVIKPVVTVSVVVPVDSIRRSGTLAANIEFMPFQTSEIMCLIHTPQDKL